MHISDYDEMMMMMMHISDYDEMMMMVCQNNHCAQAKAGDQGLVGLEVVCQNTSSPDFSSGHLQFFPDNSSFPRTKNKKSFLIGYCDIKQGFSFVSPMLCEFWTHFTFIWFSWSWSDNFQHALSDNFCLTNPDHNLPIFTTESDLINETKALLSILFN